MPSPVQESLVALASAVLATVSPTDTGKFEIKLASPNTLLVPDATPIRSVTDGKVDLKFVVKNVRFTKPDIADASTVGGMPIQLFPTELLDGPAATAGVPGLLGSLSGTVPVVIDSVSSNLAVQVEVRVTVLDSKNHIDPYVNWSFSSGAAGVGGQGTSSPGTTLPTVTLQWRLPLPMSTFVGAFTELSSVAGPLPEALPTQESPRTVMVELKMSAAGVTTGWVALPPIPIAIPAIPIPTLVAFFDDVAFNVSPGQHGTLILLPDDSPISPVGPTDAALQAFLSTALVTIRDLVTGLVNNATGTSGFNPFNPFAPLASTIDSLITDLTVGTPATQIHFAKASNVAFLGPGFLIHANDPAQDRISAMLALGPEGLSVYCFDHANFDPSGGAFAVAVGVELAVAVPTLTPSDPPSIPLGALTVTTPRGTFNDCLSSVRMVKT